MSYDFAGRLQLTRTRHMRDAARRPWQVITRRLAAAAMAAVLAGGAFSGRPLTASAAPPDAAPPDAGVTNAAAAAEFLAQRHGGRAGDYTLVYQRPAHVPTTGEPLWVGKLVSSRDGSVRTVYRDAAGAIGGPELVRGREAAAAARATALERKASPELREAAGRGAALTARGRAAAPLPVAAWLQVDLDSAEAAVVAAHPEVTWLGGRPLVNDLGTVRRLRADLWTARRDAIARAASALRREVERRGGRVAYVSTSAPLVFLDLPPVAVPGLAELPVVATMGLEGRWQPTMTSAGPAVEANWATGSGDQGAGIRVGVVEYHNVRERGDLSGKVVRSHSTSGRLAFSSGFDHPTWVAGAIAGQSSTWRGVAPRASIVSSGTGGYTPSLRYDRAIIAAADWAVAPSGGDSDIVNTSLVQDTATGAEEARRYFDSIVDRDARLAVSAAGNYVNFNSWVIGSPGTGYNVLTVGGVDDRGTGGRSDDRIWYVPGSNGSNWLDRPSDSWNAHGDYNKPNLVAPAVGVRTANGLAASGTSVATPIVAGVAAQVLSNEPVLVAWPEGARAVLMAGAIHRVRMPDGSRNVDHEGVGMISAAWANRAAHAGDNQLGGYRLGVLSAGEQPIQDIAVRAGDRLRVALAWNSHTSGSRNLDLRDRLRADLDLRVTDPDGRVVGSFTIDNAYEFVEIRIERSGTARLQVVQARFDGASETYGLAWIKVRELVPPTATALVPKPGEPWAVPSAQLRVGFSEAVQGVSARTFFLLRESGERVGASVSYSSSTHEARLVPDRALSRGRYHAVLRSSITDRAGNALQRKTWTFRVKGPAEPIGEAFAEPRRLVMKAGTHVGYRFDPGGRVTDSRSAELEARANAGVTERRTLPGVPGTWLLVADGPWAGYWMRESGVAGLRGKVGAQPWSEPQPVALRSGSHVAYRYDESGNVTGSRTRRVATMSEARASARAVINGTWHLRMADGRWAGYWLAESRMAFIRGPLLLADLGAVDARIGPGERTAYRYNGRGEVTGRYSAALASEIQRQSRAWAIVNGRPSLYMEAGGWAGYWLPETGGVRLP